MVTPTPLAGRKREEKGKKKKEKRKKNAIFIAISKVYSS